MLKVADSDKIPGCVVCGCLGNGSCGHAPLNPELCCTLDASGVCPCCNKAGRHCEGCGAKKLQVADVVREKKKEAYHDDIGEGCGCKYLEDSLPCEIEANVWNIALDLPIDESKLREMGWTKVPSEEEIIKIFKDNLAFVPIRGTLRGTECLYLNELAIEGLAKDLLRHLQEGGK